MNPWICGVRVAESLLTGLVFTFHCARGSKFVSGICKLNRDVARAGLGGGGLKPPQT